MRQRFDKILPVKLCSIKQDIFKTRRVVNFELNGVKIETTVDDFCIKANEYIMLRVVEENDKQMQLVSIPGEVRGPHLYWVKKSNKAMYRIF